MFGENIGVQINTQFYKKTVSALLIFSFSVISLTSTVRGANIDRTKNTSKSAKQNPANVKMDNFVAESFAGATKLAWKTSYEQNMLGFKLWREESGQRICLNQEPVVGSIFKVGNGVLPAGSEYVFYDKTDSTNVYYWLEAIDINGQSSWFGPVYPQANFSEASLKTESATIAGLNSNAPDRGQIEKIELSPSKAARKGFAAVTAAATSAQNNLVTTSAESLKIEVRNRGMYRIDAQALAEMGYSNVAAGNWKLYMGGVEQPMVVNADGSMEFFGQGLDTVQTDTNIYWLTPDATAGQRINRSAQSFVQSAGDGWTSVTAERRDRYNRLSTALNGARENWFGAVIGAAASNQTLVLNDIATASGQTATVGVDIQGVTSNLHQVTVRLNGVSIGQIVFAALDRATLSVNVPLANLVEGTNTITLQSAASNDVSVTESIRITYPRQLKARNDRLDMRQAPGQAVKLKGFASSQVRVFDVTNPAQVSEIAPESRQETDGTYTVTLASSPTERLILAQGSDAQMFSATPLITNSPSDLRNTANAAKFIVIAPREFRKMLTDFIWLRNLRGLQTVFVDVQDIYDEFNNGVRSAESIRSFLQYAKQNWAVKPDFVMFAGDGSVDPRNYSGMGGDTKNRVPTMFVDTWNIEAVSDEMMVDFDGDNVGEIAVGRLPAENQDELEAMLEKIINSDPLSVSEINARGTTFVSDGPIGYDFAGASRNMASVFPSGIAVNYLDAEGQDPNALRNTIVDRISAGPAIVNYFGHASVGAWTSQQIFGTADAPRLTNIKRSPFMLIVACLTGDFAEQNVNGVAEAVMKKWRGGAHAVWAASGWNTAFEQEYQTRDFYTKAFTGMPLGEAARQTKLLNPGADLRRTYVFFGDPTQPLVAR